MTSLAYHLAQSSLAPETFKSLILSVHVFLLMIGGRQQQGAGLLCKCMPVSLAVKRSGQGQ